METESITCASCLNENQIGIHFCKQCGAPIGDFTTTMPFERIQAEGFAYREATSNPRKPIVVIGIYILFLPGFLAFLATVIFTIIQPGALGLLLPMTFLGVVSFVILYKTTKNFIKNRQSGLELTRYDE